MSDQPECAHRYELGYADSGALGIVTLVLYCTGCAHVVKRQA